jgi:hypothetical protein
MSALKWIFWILVSAAFSLVIAYYFLPDVLSAKNPLPSGVQAGLDRLEWTGLSVRESAKRAKLLNKNAADLVEPEYGAVADRVSFLINKSRDGIRMKSIDEAFLIPELEATENRAVKLDQRLAGLVARSDVEKLLNIVLRQLDRVLNAGGRKWERLSASESELDQIVIAQLGRMHWPKWKEIRPGL